MSINTEPAAKAIEAYANSATLVLTGSGGDIWATHGSGNLSVYRSFTVTIENYPEEAES